MRQQSEANRLFLLPVGGGGGITGLLLVALCCRLAVAVAGCQRCDLADFGG